ncbi:MAG: penicillin-binding protein, partial [Clostridia bacterium]|nr:penicillin-binding protein [Clostridia bacterium]
KGYVLHTAFDPMVFAAMKTGFAQGGTDQLDFACACTDLKGKLVAVFSNGVENFAIRRTQPYSSFKPLSVYMQALERGIINWSTVYRDEPLKQITGEDGQLHNWPANASNTYSYENTPVSFAVKKSLNTVASACLLDVGVANSISFLKKNFGISMPTEEMRMNLVGEEEIIGNLSMGFLTDGVSPVEMAGFYQCFANGGTYAAPTALEKIEAAGKVICEPSTEEKRVLTEANAHIMNRLLQQVIGPEGTGSAARLEGIPLGGKTGTGDNGNWFVGFTPEYSCSVWHGDQLGENAAAKYFAQIFSEIELDPEAAFPESESVKQGIYCKRTGLLYSDACHDADVGYYESGKMPVFCKE